MYAKMALRSLFLRGSFNPRARERARQQSTPDARCGRDVKGFRSRAREERDTQDQADMAGRFIYGFNPRARGRARQAKRP